MCWCNVSTLAQDALPSLNSCSPRMNETNTGSIRAFVFLWPLCGKMREQFIWVHSAALPPEGTKYYTLVLNVTEKKYEFHSHKTHEDMIYVILTHF